jgi:hypothetical protein
MKTNKTKLGKAVSYGVMPIVVAYGLGSSIGCKEEVPIMPSVGIEVSDGLEPSEGQRRVVLDSDQRIRDGNFSAHQFRVRLSWENLNEEQEKSLRESLELRLIQERPNIERDDGRLVDVVDTDKSYPLSLMVTDEGQGYVEGVVGVNPEMLDEEDHRVAVFADIPEGAQPYPGVRTSSGPDNEPEIMAEDPFTKVGTEYGESVESIVKRKAGALKDDAVEMGGVLLEKAGQAKEGLKSRWTEWRESRKGDE